MTQKVNKSILLGYSGHGYVVAEAALSNGIKLLGYAERKESDQNPYQLAYLGDETFDQFTYWMSCGYYILGVGSNEIRARIATRVKEKGGKCLVVVHPDSSLANEIMIGSGTFVARNVSVNPLVQIGENVILNTSCIVEHECQIGNNVHIAPRASVLGGVAIGDYAFIGSGSVIKHGITIGKGAIIGAGSIVLKDIGKSETWVGNPAKRIK